MLCTQLFSLAAFLGSLQSDPSKEALDRARQAHIYTELNVHVIEEFDEPREHREYRQPFPVEHSLRIEGGRGLVTGNTTFFSECRWKAQEPVWIPRAPAEPRLSVSIAGCLQEITVTADFIEGSALTGNPRNDPGSTKPSGKSGLSGSSDGEVEDSDRPYLYGPTFQWPVKEDVTEWDLAGWLPAGTTLSLYARALFGEFEVFDLASDIELYSVGALLEMPLLGSRPSTVRISGVVSAGPGWMRTDLGDATGLESTAGLQVLLILSEAFSTTLIVGGTSYLTDGLLAWGPVVSLGANLRW